MNSFPRFLSKPFPGGFGNDFQRDECLEDHVQGLIVLSLGHLRDTLKPSSAPISPALGVVGEGLFWKYSGKVVLCSVCVSFIVIVQRRITHETI